MPKLPGIPHLQAVWRWFEKAYRVTLPDAFAALLRTANGGVPVASVFDQAGRERLIERFLPLLSNPKDEAVSGWCDITVVVTQLDSRLIDDPDLVGMNVIPIAALFGGDFACLNYRTDRSRPAVAVWDHEQSDEFAPHLEKVADSFDAFLRTLKRPRVEAS